MNGFEFATAAIAATFGGALGALAALGLAGARLSSDFNAFRGKLEPYLAAKTDDDSRAISDAFRMLLSDWGQFLAAFDKARGALRMR